jgi:hypothetical protein
MAWVDASLAASASATISPTLTSDTSTNINFGAGDLYTPNTNNITSQPSTEAQATSAFGGPAESNLGALSSGSGTDAGSSAIPWEPILIGALAVAVAFLIYKQK